MNGVQRLRRHLRLVRQARTASPTPPFLVLFVNSVCNMKCDHCFYWRSLNDKQDLTQEEICALSRSLGRVEILNLSGGEPFIRRDVAEICREFVRFNGVREIYVPTNGYFTERTVDAVHGMLAEPGLALLAIELSLDGLAAYHDEFRRTRNAFAHAMATYDALARVQAVDARLRIHAVSTANRTNLAEVRRLSTFLYERCPRMDHHNLAIIRGDRKNAALQGPQLHEYAGLYDYIRRLWAPRERERYGSSVEPMLQWAKLCTLQRRKQVVPCLAGRLTGVVYANGDVSVCEQHPPIGNLRERPFPEIWQSEEARRLRAAIRHGDCYCTSEVFLWPSLAFQPAQLARALVGGRVWSHPPRLRPEERADPAADDGAALEALVASRRRDQLQPA